MGNSLHRKFVNFTNQRLTNQKISHNSGRYYLSEIMCEWVWGAEGYDIYKWAKDKEIVTHEDYRSVTDMIYLIKKLRKHRSEPEFTKEERERYLMFIRFRRNRKIGNHTIYVNYIPSKAHEYLMIP